MFNYLTAVKSGSGVPALNNIKSISDVLAIALNVLMGAGFAIALASIGWSAIQYTLSAGDPKAASTAWSTFLWGVIAAAVSLGALGIKVAILGTTGVKDANLTNALPNF